MFAPIRKWVTSPLGLSLAAMFAVGFSLGNIAGALRVTWLGWLAWPIGLLAGALLVQIIRFARRDKVDREDVSSDDLIEVTLEALGDFADQHGGRVPVGRCKSCGKVHPFPDQHREPNVWN